MASLIQPPFDGPDFVHFSHTPCRLPQEIMDFIVDIFSSSAWDVSYLQACNRVSRSFHARVRKHIFRMVFLGVDPGKVECRRSTLLRDLLENPSVSEGVGPLIRDFQIKPTGHFFARPWKYIDQNLPHILRAIPALECLSLQLGSTNWADISSDIRLALWELHGHPTIHTLRIANHSKLYIPVEFFGKWPALKNCCVEGQPFATLQRRDGTTSQVPTFVHDDGAPQLESLSLVNPVSVEFLGITGKEGVTSLVRKLKILRVRVATGSHCMRVCEIFRHVGDSLTTLEMENFLRELIMHGDNISPVLEQSSFHSLQEVSITERHLGFESMLPSVLANCILPFASCKTIQTIRLDFCWNRDAITHSGESDRGGLTYEQQCLDPTAWHRLDEVLSSARSLRLVEVKVTLNASGLVEAGSAGGMERHARFETLSERWTPQKVFPQLSAVENVSVCLLSEIMGHKEYDWDSLLTI